MNIVIIVQARMSSSRLPGKIQLPLAGAPLLARMVERAKAAKLANQVIVATSTESSDDGLVALGREFGFHVFRGALNDLLDRHYQAALACQADVVLKIPSDCPLIDPAIIDKVISFYLSNAHQYDFVSNLHPATYPDGNDVEIMPFSVLKSAWENATRPLEREHTTPYIWENQQMFRVGNVTWECGLDYSMSHRWTIDYPADYEFINEVYKALYSDHAIFDIDDILNLLQRQPALMHINSRYAGVNWYRNHLDELKTVSRGQTKQLL